MQTSWFADSGSAHKFALKAAASADWVCQLNKRETWGGSDCSCRTTALASCKTCTACSCCTAYTKATMKIWATPADMPSRDICCKYVNKLLLCHALHPILHNALSLVERWWAQRTIQGSNKRHKLRIACCHESGELHAASSQAFHQALCNQLLVSWALERGARAVAGRRVDLTGNIHMISCRSSVPRTCKEGRKQVIQGLWSYAKHDALQVDQIHMASIQKFR